MEYADVFGIPFDFTAKPVVVRPQKPRETIAVKAGSKKFQAIIRIDTPQEVLYYQHGGILQYVLRQLLAHK